MKRTAHNSITDQLGGYAPSRHVRTHTLLEALKARRFGVLVFFSIEMEDRARPPPEVKRVRRGIISRSRRR